MPKGPTGNAPSSRPTAVARPTQRLRPRIAERAPVRRRPTKARRPYRCLGGRSPSSPAARDARSAGHRVTPAVGAAAGAASMIGGPLRVGAVGPQAPLPGDGPKGPGTGRSSNSVYNSVPSGNTRNGSVSNQWPTYRSMSSPVSSGHTDRVASESSIRRPEPIDAIGAVAANPSGSVRVVVRPCSIPRGTAGCSQQACRWPPRWPAPTRHRRCGRGPGRRSTACRAGRAGARHRRRHLPG